MEGVKNIEAQADGVGQSETLRGSDEGVRGGEEGEGKKGRPLTAKQRLEASILMLPEEVWLLIFKELKDDEDLDSCCKASTYFDSALNSSKPLWQFKKVVHLVSSYLPINLILKCRSVCKQWRTDIDTFTQSKPYLPFLRDDVFYSFNSVSDISQFLQTFSDHPGNPFLDRTVHFSNEADEPGFATEVDTFMYRFGSHIWNLQITSLNVPPFLFYNHLHLVLTQATALRHLCINGQAMDGEILDDGEIDMRAMSAYFLSRPLPFIPSLTSLWFRLDWCLDDIYILLMLPYATQLKSLSMNMQSWKDFYARGLLHLKVVFLFHISSDNMLAKLLQLHAPIETMTLTFSPYLPVSTTLALLIEVVCHFPLMKDLTLFLSEEGEVIEPEGEDAIAALYRLRNPTVKMLHLTHSSKFSYIFLRAFPSLEDLRVGLKSPLATFLAGQPESEKDVQFYMMLIEGGMYSSNIWELFPSLKYVDVYDCTYEDGMPNRLFDHRGNREDYQRYKSHKPFYKKMIKPL